MREPPRISSENPPCGVLHAHRAHAARVPLYESRVFRGRVHASYDSVEHDDGRAEFAPEGHMVRDGLFYESPEGARVVEVCEVAYLMHNDVIREARGQERELVVEAQVAARRATPPPRLLRADGYPRVRAAVA